MISNEFKNTCIWKEAAVNKFEELSRYFSEKWNYTEILNQNDRVSSRETDIFKIQPKYYYLHNSKVQTVRNIYSKQ
jgi:hypothetical protein